MSFLSTEVLAAMRDELEKIAVAKIADSYVLDIINNSEIEKTAAKPLKTPGSGGGIQIHQKKLSIPQPPKKVKGKSVPQPNKEKWLEVKPGENPGPPGYRRPIVGKLSASGQRALKSRSDFAKRPAQRHAAMIRAIEGKIKEHRSARDFAKNNVGLLTGANKLNISSNLLGKSKGPGQALLGDLKLNLPGTNKPQPLGLGMPKLQMGKLPSAPASGNAMPNMGKRVNLSVPKSPVVVPPPNARLLPGAGNRLPNLMKPKMPTAPGQGALYQNRNFNIGPQKGNTFGFGFRF